MLKLSHLVVKIGTQYDLNLERNTEGLERKSLGFER